VVIAVLGQNPTLEGEDAAAAGWFSGGDREEIERLLAQRRFCASCGGTWFNGATCPPRH
jgi:hypothetical protein